MSSVTYVDKNVRRMSTDSKDIALLTNIEGGGLTGSTIGAAAKYH